MRSTATRLSVICLLLMPVLASGQSRLSTSARLMQVDMNPGIDLRSDIRQLAGHYDLEQRNGTWYADAVAMVNSDVLDEEVLRSLDVHINSRLQGMVTMRFPVDRLEQIAQVPGIRYISMGSAISYDLEHSRRDTRADSVNAGLGGLAMGYDGAGVVVAVIDWGFDYTHPVFRDSTTGDLRISRAWDQNKLSGPAPVGFDYGAEYSGADELLAAGADTMYVFGPMSHGTHVAGIAAGNGAGTTHIGMAPGAELVMISLRRTEASFIDAITYVRDHALSVGKPFVVNMSFGGHQGPHDGSDVRNVAMAQMAGPGRVFVGSAGNNGTSSFHLKWPATSVADTMRTVVNFGTVSGFWGQSISIYGQPGGTFSVGLRLVDNANTTVFQSAFHHTADAPLVNDTIILAPGDTLIMRLAGEEASPFNGRPNALLDVRRTGTWKVILELSGEGGDTHLWNVMRLTTRTTNWGANFASNYPGAVAGNDQYGLGEPAGVGPAVITVASHRASQVNGAGSTIYGALSTFSSRGPTVDERMKPDICAPGQSVRSSVNSFDITTVNAPQTVQYEGNTYPFDTYSGTSMSAPAVSGVVALVLQANPWLSADDVKSILRSTARLDNHTGNIGPGGNTSWGWGKVNALAAVLAAAAFTSTPEVSIAPDNVVLFPNPANDQVRVQGMDPQRVRLFDINGAVVFDRTWPKEGGEHIIPLHGLASGTYVVELSTTRRTVIQRVVIP